MAMIYKKETQCPCCGKEDGVLVAKISDDMQNIELSGMAYKFLSRPYHIELSGQNSTKLQKKVDRIEVSATSQVVQLIKNLMGLTITLSIVLFGFQCTKAFASTRLGVAKADIMQIYGIVTVVGVVVIVLAMIYYIFGLPQATVNDKVANGEADLTNQYLEQYYTQLRYCKHCHVVYDRQGYYCLVQYGVIDKLAKNAGIFFFRAIETKRSLNEKLS